MPKRTARRTPSPRASSSAKQAVGLIAEGKTSTQSARTQSALDNRSHRTRTELVQGTLEMLVLKTLALEPMHGWGIAQRIEQLSHDVFLVTQGSLYPALVRMRRRGWITSSWRVTENNRRARYYSLTAAGERQLESERAEWRRASGAVNGILNARLAPGTT